jgi:Zn-dependent protease with chaperone function
MFPTDLRSARERRLRVLAFVISSIAWLAVVASIIGVIYGAFIALAIAIAHALWLGHVRGNGVRLGPQQLPHLWSKVTAASQKVGLREPPATYLMQSGGVLNAFATKLFGRRFVILNSALVEACERGVSGVGPTEIDFVIAHETAHLAAGHLSWFLLPVRIIPLLGPAWSRACEYTCDRAGQAFVGNLETSSRALAILAAGARAGRALDLDQFVAQRDESGRFWMAVYELNSTHPYLPKRIAALREAEQPGAATAVGRNVVAYPLAPLFGMFAGGGAGSAGLFVIAMIGMMASIALPSFERYMALSRQAAARSSAPVSDSATPTASSDREAVTPAGVVRGDRFDWTVKLPGPKWELLPTKEARQQNQLADRWLTRRDLDAHVMVVAEHLNGQELALDTYADAVMGNVRKAATKFKIARQSAIPGGRLVEVHSTVNGLDVVQLIGLVIHGGNAYQVFAFSSTSSFDRAKPELLRAIASFTPAD